jgi:hypothetical protein
MLTISQLAAYAGVTVRAVRHYHQIGLLPEADRGGALLVGELAVDGVEELDQVLGVRPGGADAVLVVADLVEEQAEVAVLLFGANFGQELGLGAAGPS